MTMLTQTEDAKMTTTEIEISLFWQALADLKTAERAGDLAAQLELNAEIESFAMPTLRRIAASSYRPELADRFGAVGG